MIGLGRQALGALIVFAVGWLVGEVRTARPSRPLPPCVCGCSAERHEHFRRGLDCGACGADDCPEYEPTTEYDRREHARAVAEAEAPRWDPAEVEYLDDGRPGYGLASLLAAVKADQARTRADAAAGRPPLH